MFYTCQTPSLPLSFPLSLPLSLCPSLLPYSLPSSLSPLFLTQEIDIVIEFMYSGGLHLAIDADLVGLSQYITSVAWYITNTVFVQDFAEPLQHCIYSSELSAFHILKVQSSMPSI